MKRLRTQAELKKRVAYKKLVFSQKRSVIDIFRDPEYDSIGRISSYTLFYIGGNGLRSLILAVYIGIIHLTRM